MHHSRSRKRSTLQRTCEGDTLLILIIYAVDSLVLEPRSCEEYKKLVKCAEERGQLCVTCLMAKWSMACAYLLPFLDAFSQQFPQVNCLRLVINTCHEPLHQAGVPQVRALLSQVQLLIIDLDNAAENGMVYQHKLLCVVCSRSHLAVSNFTV